MDRNFCRLAKRDNAGIEPGNECPEGQKIQCAFFRNFEAKIHCAILLNFRCPAGGMTLSIIAIQRSTPNKCRSFLITMPLFSKKYRTNVPLKQIRRHIFRYDILICLKRLQITITQLRRNLEADMQQLPE